MASRAFCELLLRPSSFTRIQPHSLRWLSQTPARSAQPARQEDDADPYSLKPRRPRETEGLQNESQQQQQQQQRRRPASQSDTTRAINSLFHLPTNAPRNSGSSADEMRAARTTSAFGANFSPPGAGRGRGRGANRPTRLNFDDMDAIPGEGNSDAFGMAPQETTAQALARQQEEAFASYPRLNPSYGRTIDLDPTRGRDIVRGIGMMGSMMARNKVKLDFNRQKFHERGGLKRKRLNSERWRARFKEGFKQVTGRVNELTRKGW